MHISANRIEAEPDDGEHCALLFFGECSGRYLSLARGNRDDNDLGVEIEINEQSYCATGAVTRCCLCIESLHVHLHPEVQPKLGATEIIVSLPIPCSALPAIRDSLRNIFRGHTQFEDRCP